MAVRCGKWDDLLAMSEPAGSDKRVLKAFWLYGRGMALAARGKLAEAEACRNNSLQSKAATPRRNLHAAGAEPLWQIFHIADDVLGARIAAAKGDKTAAIALLRDAVATQDQLLYDEPADWYYPVRESLGGMLLQSGDVKAAEQVFRDDLDAESAQSALALRTRGGTDPPAPRLRCLVDQAAIRIRLAGRGCRL